MINLKNNLMLTGLFLLVINNNIALADTIVKYTISDNNNESTDHTMHISNGKIRFLNQPGSTDPEAYFDSKTSTLSIIDHSKRQYIPINENEVKLLTSQVDDFLGGVFDQLQIENPLAAEMNATNIEQKHTGLQNKIAGISCDQYTVYEDGKKLSNICVSPFNRLDMNPQDYETLRNLYSTSVSLMDNVGSFLSSSMLDVPNFNIGDVEGLPISIQSLGNSKTEIKLTEFNQAPVDKSILSIPNGYSQGSITTIIQ